MAVPRIPEDHRGFTPYLIIRGAAEAIAFYERAFGAKELLRLTMPTGVVAHAEMQVGGARLMMADEFPDMGVRGPASLGGSTVSLLLYVEDVDAAFARALDAGATVMRPLADQFYGDRAGTLTDPFGHIWTLASRIEDVSAEEMVRRFRGFSERTEGG